MPIPADGPTAIIYGPKRSNFKNKSKINFERVHSKGLGLLSNPVAFFLKTDLKWQSYEQKRKEQNCYFCCISDNFGVKYENL